MSWSNADASRRRTTAADLTAARRSAACVIMTRDAGVCLPTFDDIVQLRDDWIVGQSTDTARRQGAALVADWTRDSRTCVRRTQHNDNSQMRCASCGHELSAASFASTLLSDTSETSKTLLIQRAFCRLIFSLKS